MTPLINAMITGLKYANINYKIGEKKKQLSGIEIAILTFIALTSLPAFTNRNGNNILPDYWIIAFPVTFYLIGHYIRSVQWKLKRNHLITVIATIVVGESLMNIVTGNKCYLYFYGGHDSLVYLVLAVALFLLLKDFSMGNRGRMVVNKIAALSLNIYLIGYLFDSIFHSLWCSSLDYQWAYLYFPYNVACFVASITASLGIAYLYDLLYKNIKNKFQSIKNK